MLNMWLFYGDSFPFIRYVHIFRLFDCPLLISLRDLFKTPRINDLLNIIDARKTKILFLFGLLSCALEKKDTHWNSFEQEKKNVGLLSQCQMNKYQSGTNAGKLETVQSNNDDKKRWKKKLKREAVPTTSTIPSISFCRNLSSRSFHKVKRSHEEGRGEKRLPRLFFHGI